MPQLYRMIGAAAVQGINDAEIQDEMIVPKAVVQNTEAPPEMLEHLQKTGSDVMSALQISLPRSFTVPGESVRKT